VDLWVVCCCFEGVKAIDGRFVIGSGCLISWSNGKEGCGGLGFLEKYSLGFIMEVAVLCILCFITVAGTSTLGWTCSKIACMGFGFLNNSFGRLIEDGAWGWRFWAL